MKEDEFREIVFGDIEIAKILFGQFNENLNIIGNNLGVNISSRGNRLLIYGEPSNVEIADKVINEFYSILSSGKTFNKNEIEIMLKNYIKPGKEDIERKKTKWHNDNEEKVIFITTRNKKISPKSKNQRDYIDAIEKYDLVFGIGPAGTGKTYLAMAMGVKFLKERLVDRIILTRPAIEAGEKLGFLPGDIYEKVNPYLRPLYDAIHDMMEFNQVTRLVERGIIEIAPLAFMRGRTLNSAFIILDEAQNTTSEQMKMFLTRIGFDSKVVVTGDITQIDLPKDQVSGLINVMEVLKDIKSIKFIIFNERDVVRHPLVQEIIKAYQRNK